MIFLLRKVPTVRIACWWKSEKKRVILANHVTNVENILELRTMSIIRFHFKLFENTDIFQRRIYSLLGDLVKSGYYLKVKLLI